jgi:prolyl-tRNA editing enzyme YbaK/EbsC (Cys-tRNA(Pro) deacylase)
MPDADGAYAATGYLRGTITPFGSSHRWPVIADVSIAGRTISMGAGAHGVAVTVAGDDVIAALAAQVADGGDVADVADVADKADVADPA